MPTPLANALSQYAPPQQTPSTPLAQALMDYASRVQGDFQHGLDESAQGFGEMVNGQLATGIPRTFLGGLGWMGSPVSGAVSPLLNPVLQPVAQGVHDYVGKPVENATGYPADLTTELALALALPKALHGAGKVVNHSVPYLASLGDAVGSRMGGAPEGALLSGPHLKAPEDGIIAYHGSPHTFDKFSMDKIGTGEGAQAYGHGLYFAENENVALDYKKALAGKGLPLREIVEKHLSGTPLKEQDVSAIYSAAIHSKKDPVSAAKTVQMASRELRDEGQSFASGAQPGEIQSKISKAIEEIRSRSEGSTYQVRLNVKPHELLDWDKPLSEQPKHVQDAINRAAGMELDPSASGMSAQTNIYLARGSKNGVHPSQAQSFASEEMKKAGIKGIRYKDAGSRDGAGGTHNFVIFDDKLIDILKRYGIPMTAGVGGAMLVSGQHMPPEVANQIGPPA